MRTVLVYLLALAAVSVAAVLSFPEMFEATASDTSPGARQKAAPPPVVVAIVAREPFSDTLEALGTVLANESVEITPNRADHIAAIHFDDGQQVESGDLLVEMNAAEERALLAEATALRDERKLRHAQAVELFEQQNLSKRDLDNAKALLHATEARVVGLQAAIDDREVRAPFAGTLGLRRVSVGAYVTPTTVITTLDDLRVVKLDFTIPETWLPSVREDMGVQARSDAWPSLTFTGRIANVDTRLDPRTRSAVVRARLPNPDHKLRPGMLLKAKVQRGDAPVLQIPEEALIPVGEKQFVLRVEEDDIARRHAVEIGRRRLGIVEVLKGLFEGDRVVVEGIIRVRPDAPVRVVKTRGDA